MDVETQKKEETLDVGIQRGEQRKDTATQKREETLDAGTQRGEQRRNTGIYTEPDWGKVENRNQLS